MSLINAVYTYGVWPATSPLLRGIGGRLRAWRRQESQSLEQNREAQWQALRRLLRHAYDSAPFYRARFQAAGLHPDAIQAPGDLHQLPPLTRADLRDNLDGVVSNKYPRAILTPAASGGTTDTPVPMFRDFASLASKRAVQESFNAWAGMRPGDRVLWLWGAQSDYAENPSWRWRLYDRGLMRRIWLPTSRLNAEVLERYRAAMNRFRPRIIAAYPTPLQLFCEYLESCGRDYWRPMTAVCTAEALLPEQRTLIERVLGCRVFDHYGSREFSIIAAECEAHRGLHLNPLAAYVEYEPLAAGANQPSDMLVTDLLNFGMPLIRYRINDCAAPEHPPEACPCGRGYPLLRPILGRTADVLQLPNGDLLPGVSLTNRLLKVVPGLAKTQITQETLLDFNLRYVPGESFSPADLERLRVTLDKFFTPAARWNFQAVAEIPREPSGKTRFCISKLGRAQIAS